MKDYFFIQQMHQEQTLSENPTCDLLATNGKLWGVMSLGGEYAAGTLFSIELDGSNYNKVGLINEITKRYKNIATMLLLSQINSHIKIHLHPNTTGYKNLFTHSHQQCS